MPQQITQITPFEPACFGVLCNRHEHCNRYHAAEGQPVTVLDTCSDGESYPLFVRRHQAQQEAQVILAKDRVA